MKGEIKMNRNGYSGVVVKTCEVVETNKPIFRLAKLNGVDFNPFDPSSQISNINYSTEIIKLHDFHYRGRDYSIGWSRDVEDAIGIPLTAFENMLNDLQLKRDETKRISDKYDAIVSRFRNMSLWERVKFVFSHKV